MDVLIVVLLLFAVGGVVPWWGYSHSWGWTPGGIVGLILFIVALRALLGRL